MKIVYSSRARQDIDGVLTRSAEQFGDRQAGIYSDLLNRTVAMAAEDPARPSSVDRGELLAGLRSLHVSLAAGSPRRASHQLFYRVGLAPGGDARLEIVRVLHHSMDAAAHIASRAAGLRTD